MVIERRKRVPDSLNAGAVGGDASTVFSSSSASASDFASSDVGGACSLSASLASSPSRMVQLSAPLLPLLWLLRSLPERGRTSPSTRGELERKK